MPPPRRPAPTGGVGIDDVDLFDLYSCFPSAIEAAVEGLGIDPDHRCLTVTGGLPYFGGPGNNYTTHAIATLTDRLREGEGPGAGAGGCRASGWPTGSAGSSPSTPSASTGPSHLPAGSVAGTPILDQQAIDASAVEVALEVDEDHDRHRGGHHGGARGRRTPDGLGKPVGAPVIARLPDGRHLACIPADDEVLAAMGDRDVPGLVGTDLFVQPGPPRYRLP